ncbi:MAG: alpha-galactosidase [bacterium]
MKLKIALVGAGSEKFGPASIRDVLLSNTLCNCDLHLVLMDINGKGLPEHQKYAEDIARRLNRKLHVSNTTSLEAALEGADFIITSIEIRRYFYWSQDFHIPRKYGFPQIYGENGGPGGLFHALRNYQPMLDIAKAMERVCPNAWMLNYTNPLTKICEMLTKCTKVKVIGLCHGVFQGIKQIARLLDMDAHDLKAYSSGLNHFTWFHSIHHAKTGEDLYPKLKAMERKAHWLAEWDEMALNRMVFRVFGLYPSPGANHIGEYIRWASEFLASSKLQYFYDPRAYDPWKEKKAPTFLYNLDVNPTSVPLNPKDPIIAMYPKKEEADPDAILPSGELAIPIIEGLACDVEDELAAVNISNSGNCVPGLPQDSVVEVPAVVNSRGLHPMKMPALPEGPLSFLRTQASIHKLLVEACQEKSRNKLLQALLLDPTTCSYHNAVHLINEMFELQAEALPKLTWD